MVQSLRRPLLSLTPHEFTQGCTKLQPTAGRAYQRDPSPLLRPKQAWQRPSGSAGSSHVSNSQSLKDWLGFKKLWGTEPSMVLNVCNPSAEAGESLVWGQPRLYSKTLSPKTNLTHTHTHRNIGVGGSSVVQHLLWEALGLIPSMAW
jgi:hypothetical protein